MRLILPSAIFLMIILIGIGCTAIGLWQAFRSIESEYWPVAQGTILSSQMVSYQAKSRRIYIPKVSYDYRVAGSNYVGERFAFGKVEGYPDEIQLMLEEYPVGKTVRIHYSSSNPQLAVLETGIHGGLFVYIFGGALFVAVPGLILYLARKGKFKGQTSFPRPRI